uniref:Uncharacterized protein n=1 Tax=Heterorhabditis bacteriophora TaxID=37862 RepID=A0A1I7WBA1_HETBA
MKQVVENRDETITPTSIQGMCLERNNSTVFQLPNYFFILKFII